MKKLTILSSFFVILLSFLVLDLTSRKNEALISPLFRNQKVLGLNQWLPQNLANSMNAPQISAKAAFFLDTRDGKVLYSKNIHERLAIASLAKVMTVLVVLEHKGMDEEFWVSERASLMEPDKMLLIAQEKLTLKELLYGIFLVSANDAAEVIAEGTTGDREEFINLMNDKAKQLGMNNTHFINPTGLDEDVNNTYSTAYDLAILTRYIIKRYPQVVEISSKDHVYLPRTQNHQDYDMYSGINLLTTYSGVVGFKTGYTPEAGLTLITLARKNNREVIGILLGTEDRRNEARELLDYSFNQSR